MCVKTPCTSALVTSIKNKNNNGNHNLHTTPRSVTTQPAKCWIFPMSSSPNRQADAQSLSAVTCHHSILPSGWWSGTSSTTGTSGSSARTKPGHNKGTSRHEWQRSCGRQRMLQRQTLWKALVPLWPCYTYLCLKIAAAKIFTTVGVPVQYIVCNIVSTLLPLESIENALEMKLSPYLYANHP